MVLLSLGLTACGGSSNGAQGTPPDTSPAPAPMSLELLDALPQNGVTSVDPGIPDTMLSHFGYADFSFDVRGDCIDGTTIQRRLVDTSTGFDALFEHDQVCAGLTATGAFETDVEATRDNGDSFTVRLDFSTTTTTAPALQVQDAVTTPRDSVAGLFQTFVDQSLVDQLNLPDAVAPLVEAPLHEIVDSALR